jgi:hypothetical protein
LWQVTLTFAKAQFTVTIIEYHNFTVILAIQFGDNEMKVETLKEYIKECFHLLIDQDGNLFECPLVDDKLYNERKLHEICINHRLAMHFENVIAPRLNSEKYYVDIEFNREGINYKQLRSNGQKDLVRPDIIIHNRHSGDKKKNFLVVECKKEDASDQDKKKDLKKLKGFITNQEYQYKFGLQVIYGRQPKGTLMYEKEGGIVKESIDSQF